MSQFLLHYIQHCWELLRPFACSSSDEKETGNLSQNASRNCFWDRHEVRAGQLLANCFPCLL